MTLTTAGPPAALSESPRRPTPVGRPHVVAVVVVHDGQPWLPRTLEALRRQTREPDAVIAVDTGSRDGSPDMLRQALGAERILQAPRDTGFGAAVRRGVEHAAATTAAGAGPVDLWIWVLHDDCAPDPRALELLLDAGTRSPSVGIVGAKLVAWDDADRLLEVGLTVGRGGRRDTGIDGVERDQGQHDHRTDVLAVPSAGMLVRGSVWDTLGGFDPALPLLRDDIDLCWRAHLAGHRVVLVPRAVVADAQACTRGLRPVDAIASDVRRVDRQHGLHVALARVSWPALPLLLGWLVLAGVSRALLLLAAKSPGRAWHEVRALAVVLLLPWRWMGSRWRARGRRVVPRSSLSGLMTPRFAVLRHAVGVLGGWAAREDPGDVPPLVPAEPGPTADVAQPVPLAPSRWPRRLFTHPLTLIATGLAAATALAWRDLLGRAVAVRPLTGGELRDTTADAGQLWHASLDVVRGAGFGTEAIASPAGLLHAGWVRAVQVVAGDAAPTVAVTVLLLAAPVLAAIAAYLAAGLATRSRWLRGWAALVWGGSPVLAAAAGQGRLGPVAVAVLLPMVLAAVARALTRGASGALTATFAGALGLAVIASAVPVIGVVAIVALVVSALVVRGSARVRALLLVLLPTGLLGPWVGELVARPQLLLAGPGAVADPRPGAEFGGGLTVPAAWSDLLLVPVGWPPWSPALWLGPLVLVGAAALLRGGPRGRVAAALGWLGLLGMLLAAAAPWTVLTTPGAPARTPWAGTGALLWLLTLAAAAVVAADGLQSRLARHGFGWRQLLLAPLVVVAVLAPIGGTAGWAWRGSPAPLTAPTAAGLPAVAADAATGPAGTRTLVLQATGGRLRYRLDGGEPGVAARDLPPPPASPVGEQADRALRSAVTLLVGSGVRPEGQDVIGGLHRLAVGYILVRQPAPAAVARQLDGTAGLARIGSSAGGQLWRVGSGGPEQTARVRVQAADGVATSAIPVKGPHAAVDTRLGAGPAGRLLVLAETASPRWRAELDGRALSPAVLDGPDPWRQAFALPRTGGHLVVRPLDPTSTAWRWAQLALVALVTLLALPVRRPSGELR